MISKGYHYAITIGITINFGISIDPASPRSFARGSLLVGEFRGIWIYPFP